MKTNNNINLLAIGQHEAVVTGFSVRMPSETGKSPYVVVTFRADNHIVNFFGSLKKDPTKETDAYTITMQALGRLGYTPENKATFDKDVIGRSCLIKVEHKTNERGTIAVVRFINEKKAHTTVSLADALGDDDAVPAEKPVTEMEVRF